MNVNFKTIRDAGNFEKERIVFSVSGEVEIGSFLVLLTELASDDGSPYSGRHDSFWFEDKKAKAGDLVVLYTKDGRSKSLRNKDGSSTHFFYWGLEGAAFGKPQTGIVLLRAPLWQTGKRSAEA